MVILNETELFCSHCIIVKIIIIQVGMKPVVALILLGCVFSAKGGWRADPPYYGQQYSTAPSARALWVDPVGDLLILSRPNDDETVQVVYETDNGDGTIDVVQQRLVTGQPFDLNHGLTYHNGFIYASSPTMVYRWPYTPGNRTQINVGEEVVISGIPGGGHNTRTVIFDSQGRLYVSVGSQGNVDNDSSRSRIRRFNMTGVTFPIAFNNGEVSPTRDNKRYRWFLYIHCRRYLLMACETKSVWHLILTESYTGLRMEQISSIALTWGEIFITEIHQRK